MCAPLLLQMRSAPDQSMELIMIAQLSLQDEADAQAERTQNGKPHRQQRERHMVNILKDGVVDDRQHPGREAQKQEDRRDETEEQTRTVIPTDQRKGPDDQRPVTVVFSLEKLPSGRDP